MFSVISDFVVTDFKVQGTTESRLISCLRPRKHSPPFTVQSFNAQFSRVQMSKNFYALGLEKNDMDHLRCLQHSAALVIWEQSYDASGHWDPALAQAAAETLLAKKEENGTLKKIKRKNNLQSSVSDSSSDSDSL